MKKNLRSKILLCVLAGGVLAANTAFAADAPDREVYDSYYDRAEVVENNSIYSKDSGYLKAKAEGNGSVMAYALFVNNSTATLGDVEVSAVGNSLDGIDSTVAAICATENSKVTITGGKLTAVVNEGYEYAILSDNSIVDVNSNNIVINGDILNSNGGTVNINLDTENAVLNGAVQNGGNEINLTLSNGATWNTKGGHFESEITKLTMDNGIIKPVYVGPMSVENYSGIGEVIYMHDDYKFGNGSIDVYGGRIDIENASADSVINLTVTNNNLVSTADDAMALENLNELAREVSYDANDGHITGKVTIKEGLIMPEVSGDLLFDSNNKNRGYVANVKQNSSTTTIDNIKNIAATAIVAWRQEDSTLSQRLGELRESDGGQGIWVRMSRGEFEYDGEYKNQYNFFQMGYDWAAGSWHYGAAVSHNDGQTTYTHGDGENRSTSLSLYGTWLGDKGHYADIVLKQGRLSNDFDIYTEAGHTSGDYDAWGTSLSGEYGMKVDLDGGWYVTPQAQLTLMRIGGEDYTTNNGIKVNQDSLESAIGRVGFEVGKRISDSGSIYAKASLLHDFAGSADTYLSLNGLTNSYHQDIGDTWCEAGIGFNYKTSENSYVYADVVKTFGGDVETPWQWNAGMRWTF